MAKVVGSYASVTRGVSEQVPQDRHPGQMWEQVNMISDPVVGLARRPGSKFKASIPVSAMNTISANQLKDMRLYRNYTFFRDNTEYVILFRGDAAAAPNDTPLLAVYNKTAGFFLNVKYADATDLTQANATGLAAWINGGVSAVSSVGDYICM